MRQIYKRLQLSKTYPKKEGEGYADHRAESYVSPFLFLCTYYMCSPKSVGMNRMLSRDVLSRVDVPHGCGNEPDKGALARAEDNVLQGRKLNQIVCIVHASITCYLFYYP